MRRMVLVLALTLAVGIAIGVAGNQLLAQYAQQPEPVKRNLLFKTDLAGIEGKEGQILLVELPPGASTGTHYHPGHEFGYLMEGSLTFDVEGKSPGVVNKGDTVYFAPKQVHNVKNASKTAPAKALVFAIAVKGEPPTVPVK